MTKAELIQLSTDLEKTVKEQAVEIEALKADRIALDTTLVDPDTSGGSIRGLSNFGDGAVIVGKAKTTYPDYKMLDLGAFPGVLMGGEHHIQGEVWEVSDEVAEHLDAIEGYPDFYNKVPTETSEGKAMMYFLGPEYNKLA